MFCFWTLKGKEGTSQSCCLDQSIIQWSFYEGKGVSLGPGGCPGPAAFDQEGWTHIAGGLQGGQISSLFLLNIAIQ